VRRQGDSAPGPRLGEIVAGRLKGAGVDPEDARWDSRKRGDGSWQVQVAFNFGGRLETAEWAFDPRRRHASPDDDNAERLSLPEGEFPPPAITVPGEATVTPLAPRLGAVSAGGGGSARMRTERPPLAPPPPVPVTQTPASQPGPPAAPPRPGPVRVPAAATEPAEPERGPEPVVAKAETATKAADRTAERDAEPAHGTAPAGAGASATGPSGGEPSVGEPARVPAEQTAAATEPKPEPEPSQPARQRKSARGRRSSVPSWDEIMLGSSRNRD
jgi:hypothetical protein